MIELSPVPVLIRLVPGPVLNPRWLADVHQLIGWVWRDLRLVTVDAPPPTELDNAVLVMEAK